MTVPARNDETSHMEDKFALIKIDDNTYEGKYQLEPYIEGARGTYGGEFVSQTLLAAWETVLNPEFVPHSLHSYFLKAGSHESPMRYVVTRTNDGRNFANRSVNVYQSATDVLCYSMIISFTRKNTHSKRKEAFERDIEGKVAMPFDLQAQPFSILDKYRDKLDKIPSIVHTNDNLEHKLPNEFYNLDSTKKIDRKYGPGDRKFGWFFRLRDDLTKAKNPTKAKFVDFAHASDSFYLSAIIRALGLPLKYKNLQFFRVSLDHTIYFHDTEFDPTAWMFLDFKFTRLLNDRLLCNCQAFTLEGRLVATIIQEALVFLPNELIKRIPEHSWPKL